MQNIVWSAKIACVSPSVGSIVRSVTIIEQKRSTRKEFEVYLIKKFGKERVMEFKRA